MVIWDYPWHPSTFPMPKGPRSTNSYPHLLIPPLAVLKKIPNIVILSRFFSFNFQFCWETRISSLIINSYSHTWGDKFTFFILKKIPAKHMIWVGIDIFLSVILQMKIVSYGRKIMVSVTAVTNHTGTFPCEWQPSVVGDGQNVLCVLAVFSHGMPRVRMSACLYVCTVYMCSLCKHGICTAVNIQRPEEDAGGGVLLYFSALFSWERVFPWTWSHAVGQEVLATLLYLTCECWDYNTHRTTLNFLYGC